MTNEELAVRIQSGETGLMPLLWEQVKLYAFKRANSFYYQHYDRCAEMGVELEDLEQEAYLGVHRAAETYNADLGVKFLTYAEYRIKGRFHIAAKLKNGGHRYKEAKLEDIKISDNSGDEVRLIDTLPDPGAEYAVTAFIDQEYYLEYQLKLSEAVRSALGRVKASKSEAVFNCLGMGLSYSQYAKQKGVSKQRVHQLVKGATEELKFDWILSDQLCALQAI